MVSSEKSSSNSDGWSTRYFDWLYSFTRIRLEEVAFRVEGSVISYLD